MAKIPIRCKGQKYLSYTQLKEFQGNLKKMPPKNLEKLKNQIIKLGWVAPIFIWKNGEANEIIDGHGRLLALRELLKEGYEIDDLPVVEIEAKSRQDAAEILLSINSSYQKITEKGLYDFLENMELDLSVLDNLELPNVDIGEVKELFAKEEVLEEDELPEINDEPKTNYGDIYTLGKHRIMCGDSFSKSDVDKLMDGKKADMVYTDPPYGINLDTDFSGMKGFGVGKKYKKIVNDHKDYDPSHVFEFFGYCKEIFLWGADYYAEKLPNKNSGSWIVWDKTECGISPNSDYEKVFGSNFELCWSKQRHKRAIARVLWKGIFGLSNEDTKSRVHPTQKPVRLNEWFIEKFSKKGDIVVDLFLGSGGTLIACEKLGRICYGMEIDPQYCDLIVSRYVKFTGNSNIMKNGEPIKWQW